VSSTSLDLLNTRFGIAGHVVFLSGPGGLPVVDISNEQASARLALQGAHLLAWAPRDVSVPVLWISEAAVYAPGQSVRGGVPLCWPWFGKASEPHLPRHGFARTSMWEVLSSEITPDGATRLRFRLPPSGESHGPWPPASAVDYVVTIGRTLELELVTRNNGDQPFVFTEAFHTYFQVSDAHNVEVGGLDGCVYLDEANGGGGTQRGPVTIQGQIDRVYLRAPADCRIVDPGLKRIIRIAKRNSTATVVWNPGFEHARPGMDYGDSGSRNMLCVETANVVEQAVVVVPGAEHRLWTSYNVEHR
jgi:glucose-6-phosphate 1-epimerase